MIDWPLLIISIAIPLVAGFLSAKNNKPGKWYSKLRKPRWMPPNWLFAPVWTVIYVLMGVALYLLIQAEAWGLVMLWIVQLSLALMWPAVFFGRQDMLYSLVTMAMLDISVIALMLASLQVNIWVTVILAPYLLWLLFATGLFETVWKNNR